MTTTSLHNPPANYDSIGSTEPEQTALTTTLSPTSPGIYDTSSMPAATMLPYGSTGGTYDRIAEARFSWIQLPSSVLLITGDKSTQLEVSGGETIFFSNHWIRTMDNGEGIYVDDIKFLNRPLDDEYRYLVRRNDDLPGGDSIRLWEADHHKQVMARTTSLGPAVQSMPIDYPGSSTSSSVGTPTLVVSTVTTEILETSVYTVIDISTPMSTFTEEIVTVVTGTGRSKKVEKTTDTPLTVTTALTTCTDTIITVVTADALTTVNLTLGASGPGTTSCTTSAATAIEEVETEVEGPTSSQTHMTSSFATKTLSLKPTQSHACEKLDHLTRFHLEADVEHEESIYHGLYVSTNKETVSTSEEPVPTNEETVSTNKETVSTDKEPVSTNKKPQRTFDHSLHLEMR